MNGKTLSDIFESLARQVWRPLINHKPRKLADGFGAINEAVSQYFGDYHQCSPNLSQLERTL